MGKYIIAILLLLVAASAHAAPTISSVSGSFSRYSSVTISGSNFTTHANYNEGATWHSSAPINATFKDFEDSSKTSNAFDGAYLNDVTITSGGPTNSAKYASVANNGSDTPAYGISQAKNSGQAMFSSFWFMIPSGGASGGKPWRWYFGPNSANDNLYLAVNCGATPYFTMQGDMLAQNGVGAIYGGTYTAATWHKVEVLASQPLGKYTIWMDGSTYLDYTTEQGGNPWSFSHTMSPNGHTVELPDMIDGTGRGCAVAGSYNYDDVYLDYTPARVEICTGSTWATRGVCNTQIPTSWGTSSVAFKVNQGTFADGSTKYLYVVDSNNAANSTGYSVTFGASSSTPHVPTAPAGVSVKNVTN